MSNATNTTSTPRVYFLGGKELPDALQPDQCGHLQFYPGMASISCTVRKVHFDNRTITYDLELWLPTPGGETYTRIYNVDSQYVTKM